MTRKMMAAFIALLITSSAFALTVGGTAIVVPKPQETNELCAEDAKVKAEVSRSVFSAYELLTCFINKKDWEENRHQYVYMVLVEKQIADKMFSTAQFSVMKKNYDTGMVQFAKAVNDIKDHPENPEALKKVEHINDFVVDHFERFSSTDRGELLIHREKTDIRINGQRVLTNVITASGLVYASGKVIRIRLSKFPGGRAEFDESDFEDVKDRVRQWVDSITAHNRDGER